jgi:glycosyltransferase involved in cell wall biosynthesis
LAAYQEADLFVLASAQTPDGNNEGVPNVLVEALAMQVPVVASRTGGIPELIQHEVTGLLVEPADHSGLASAIERMLTDDELRAAVTAAGRVKVEQEYDINVNARHLLELFRAAAG